MSRIRFGLPRVVTLPPGEIVNHDDLRIALGQPSRQLLGLWRKQRGFPHSHRDGNRAFIASVDVETWLRQHGVEVQKAEG